MADNKFLLKFRKQSMDHNYHSEIYHGKKPIDLRPIKDNLHNPPKEKETSEFYKISERFSDAMMAYVNVSAELIVINQLVRDVMPIQRVRAAIKGRSKLIKERPRFEVYECDVEAWPDITLAFKDRRQRVNFSHHLPGMMLSGAIAQFDHMLQQLVNAVITQKPELVNQSERPLTFKELQKFKSIEDARLYLSNKYVETLARQSHLEQFQTMETIFGIQLRKDLKNFPKFLELCQRRHCVIHNGGIVSQSYLEKLGEQKIDTDAKLGEILLISQPYFEESVATIFEIGFKLIQVLWRKFMPEDSVLADHEMINQPIYLLQIEKPELAADILSFALKYIKNWDSETNKLMVQVNYANALKLCGNKEKSNEVLDQIDWDTRSAQFQISVSAVKDDMEKCLTLLDQH